MACTLHMPHPLSCPSKKTCLPSEAIRLAYKLSLRIKDLHIETNIS